MKPIYFSRIPKILDIIFRGITWRKEPRYKNLYLTFDDGPNPKSTYQISHLLNKLAIKATFFCLGEHVERYPEICSKLIEEGHAIANHNFTHMSGWNTNDVDYVAGANQCQTVLEALNLTTRKFYRPPYGRVTFRQFKTLKSAGFDIINWSLMPGDFDKELTGNFLLERLLRFRNGDIIVLHDHHQTVDKLNEALPVLVKHALNQGYKFETL